jgi:DNA-binding transcriptional regulator YhcF (GntR family)
VSIKALSWVFDNSPYTLGDLLVHIAIADVANDAHEDRIWLSQAKIAAKVRVSLRTVNDAMSKMVRDGYLELVECHPGKPSVYRFTYAESAQVDSTYAKQRVEPTQNGVPHISLTKDEQNARESSYLPSDRPLSEIFSEARIGRHRQTTNKEAPPCQQ